jgi:RsbRD-like negative regulator of sigma factor
MDPEKHLEDKQQKLVEEWVDAVIGSYPKDSAQFFKNTKDPFANPVGNTVKRSIGLLCNQVIRKKMDMEAVAEGMDPIIRLRAVQEFTAADALSFIFKIKQLVRNELEELPADKQIKAYERDIEGNVDQLILVAFDIYTDCRKKIYLMRINQAKESVKKLLIKKELICEIPDATPELQSE